MSPTSYQLLYSAIYFYLVRICLLAHIGEQILGALHGFLGEFVQPQHDIVNPVRSERDAYSRGVRQSEDAGEVVVASSSTDASYGEVKGLYLENSSCIVIQSSCQ